jgi:hypothetical protein
VQTTESFPYCSVYVLAAILLTGFLLGGAAKPTKKQIEKIKEDIKEKGKEGKEEAPTVIPDSELAALVKKAETSLGRL